MGSPRLPESEAEYAAFDQIGDDDDELSCTHCDGLAYCDDGADPLGNCPDEQHPCHACGGTGNRKDQVIF